MSTKYHVGRDGMPKVCKAHSGNCPMGEETEHFTDKIDALEHATQKLEEEYGSVASHRKKTEYHIGEAGAIEICDSPESCDVKPYKKFRNVHSADQNVVIGAGQAFREAIGAINAAPGPAKGPSTLSEPEVASDPVTDEARRTRGSIKSAGSYRPKTGDYIRVKRGFPGTYKNSVSITASSDPDKELQKMIDAGIPPEAIEVLTADSCHHSTAAPDLSNTIPLEPLSRADGRKIQAGDKISSQDYDIYGEVVKTEKIFGPTDNPDQVLYDFIAKGHSRDSITVEESSRHSSSPAGDYPAVRVGPTIDPYAGSRKIEHGRVYGGKEYYEYSGTGRRKWMRRKWTDITDDKNMNPPRRKAQVGDLIVSFDSDDNLVRKEVIYNDSDAQVVMQEMIDSGTPSENIYIEPKLARYGGKDLFGDREDPDFTGVDIGSNRETSRPYRPRTGDIALTRRKSSTFGHVIPGGEKTEETLKRLLESGWMKYEITILTKDSGFTEERTPSLPEPDPTKRYPSSKPAASSSNWSSGGARC